jgi:ribosome biogenesis GTPase / thiamine phosphate phosphatase
MSLIELGWTDFFEQHLSADDRKNYSIGRVVCEMKDLWRVLLGDGREVNAEISGRFRHLSSARADLPAVGDFVGVQPLPHEHKAVIHRVLPRRTKLSRNNAGGTTDEQILAANVDTAFVVSSLNIELNARRIERYLTMIYSSGATPVVLLTKADLCSGIEIALAEISQVAPGVPVFAISALIYQGLDQLERFLGAGQTLVLLGSSGVGKSTLANSLLGRDEMKTQEISFFDKGSHTTTSRHLLKLPQGAMLIDTPGMRELQLWDDGSSGLGATFDDIEALGLQCRFGDCRHEAEPGCAIKLSLENGTLPADRYDSYIKLRRELAFHSRRQHMALQRLEKAKWKKIHVQQRQRYKHEGHK